MPHITSCVSTTSTTTPFSVINQDSEIHLMLNVHSLQHCPPPMHEASQSSPSFPHYPHHHHPSSQLSHHHSPSKIVSNVDEGEKGRDVNGFSLLRGRRAIALKSEEKRREVSKILVPSVLETARSCPERDISTKEGCVNRCVTSFMLPTSRQTCFALQLV